jgi:hypothetical protein
MPFSSYFLRNPITLHQDMKPALAQLKHFNESDLKHDAIAFEAQTPFGRRFLMRKSNRVGHGSEDIIQVLCRDQLSDYLLRY